MPPVTQGKSGTITPAEFDALASMASQYGAKTLAQKVAKICAKKADMLAHEYSASGLAAAFRSTAGRLTGAVGSSTRLISKDAFESLDAMINRYGPEVITFKLAKLAKRAGNNAEAETLKAVFPRAS